MTFLLFKADIAGLTIRLLVLDPAVFADNIEAIAVQGSIGSTQVKAITARLYLIVVEIFTLPPIQGAHQGNILI